jgi:hypothetical protein
MSLTRSATMVEDAPFEVAKPPRLNFAGVCLWCGERGCACRRCDELHARSQWVVCDQCGGFAEAECACVHGVIEATPIRRRGEALTAAAALAG